MPLKKLPLAIQTFSKIRKGDYLYVDKTQLLAELTDQEGAYFLSRPRRFGKSMLISTLHALYEGRKELFEGLYIYDKWDWDTTYPVIRIDFAGGTIETREQFDQTLYRIFENNQRHLKLDCELLIQRNDPAGYFERLIEKAHEQYGQKVVILIDEYDKPILDQITNLELANQIREGLKNVYSVMKAQDAHIQFIFMTGVSKFSKVSLFSGINQIQDISLHPRYATICGYTQRDLETTFADHLEGVDWVKLKQWYNGYNFLGDSVYNPYDILLFIDQEKDYLSYWFETGSPSFLLKLLREKEYFLPELENIEVSEGILNSFEIDRINPITLLYQTGYLTIQERQVKMDRMIYRLVVPNMEVRRALNESLIDAYSQNPEEKRFGLQERLSNILLSGDLPALEAHIKTIFAGLPWRNVTASEQKAKKSEDYLPLYEFEGYYASVMYAFFASIDIVVIPEDISQFGQTDLTLILKDKVYIMEFKLDKTKSYRKKKINPALKQIQDRQYSKKYLGQGKQVFEVGMIFNQTARNLVQMGWVNIA